MLSIAYYMLQVMICSGILMLYYWLVLRNKRFHGYNRFYLLFVSVAAWCIPLIKIQWQQPHEEGTQVIRFLTVVADNNSEIELATGQHHFSINWEWVALYGYVAVSIVFLAAFVYALFKIYKLLKIHSCKSWNDVWIVLTEQQGTPFSFFSYIFWHKDINIQSETGHRMLQHELVHVKEKHTLDKIWIQLMMVPGWFNPFFWLLRKELDMIHEFIADHQSVEAGDTAALAEMLLTAAYPQQQFSLTHPFFFSPIKRRLLMLTNNKNPRFSYLRRVIVLPLLAVVVVLFAFRKKETLPAAIKLDKTYTVVIDAGHGGTDNGATARDGSVEKDIALAFAKAVKENNNNEQINIVLLRDQDQSMSLPARMEKVKTLGADLFIAMHANWANNANATGVEMYIPNDSVSQRSKLSIGCALSIASAIEGVTVNIKSRKNNGIYMLDQNAVPSVLIECGYVSNEKDLQQLKDASYRNRFATSVLNGITEYLKRKDEILETFKNTDAITIEGNIYNAPDTAPARTKQPPAKLTKSAKLGASKSEEVVVVGYKTAKSKNADTTKPKEVVVVGYPRPTENKEVVVVGYKKPKDTVVVTGYATKKIHADTLIWVNGKKGAAKDVLYVLDGRKIVASELEVLSPNSIKSVSVLGTEDAEKYYGAAGRRGAIVIQTKKGIE